MKTIHLTKGYETIVDDELFDYLNQWKWHYNSGYAERKAYREGKQHHIPMHRVVLGANQTVDHKNGDKLDNRKANLRTVTRSQNAMNMRKHRGKSVYKGVCKTPFGWRVQIWQDNRKVFDACARTERQAGMIYDLNAPVFFGEYARLNFTERR